MKQETTTVMAPTPTAPLRAPLMLGAIDLRVTTFDAPALGAAMAFGAIAPSAGAWTRFATYVAPFGNPIANPGGEKCHHRRPKELCS